jgi:protein phosphatase
MHLNVFSYSARGAERRINQDTLCLADNISTPANSYRNYSEYELDQRYKIFCVADGLGGHSGGEVASHMAVEYVSTNIRDYTNPEELEAAIQGAHRLINSEATKIGHLEMATTIAVTLFKADALLWANVGDSRIYARDNHEFTQVSIDDIPTGLRSSNMITQCLGGNYANAVTPHTGCLAIGHINHIAIFSDGVTDFLEDDYLDEIISSDSEDPANELCAAAVKAGSHDDCTAVIINIKR